MNLFSLSECLKKSFTFGHLNNILCNNGTPFCAWKDDHSKPEPLEAATYRDRGKTLGVQQGNPAHQGGNFRIYATWREFRWVSTPLHTPLPTQY